VAQHPAAGQGVLVELPALLMLTQYAQASGGIIASAVSRSSPMRSRASG
jgi:hypothetical protein